MQICRSWCTTSEFSGITLRPLPCKLNFSSNYSVQMFSIMIITWMIINQGTMEKKHILKMSTLQRPNPFTPKNYLWVQNLNLKHRYKLLFCIIKIWTQDRNGSSSWWSNIFLRSIDNEILNSIFTIMNIILLPTNLVEKRSIE